MRFKNPSPHKFKYVKMNSDPMALKSKSKLSKLSMVPVKIGTETTDYTFEHMRNSIKLAQSADNVHAHGVHAERDVALTSRWESLPLYLQGDHMPKMELFKNFKKSLDNLSKV